MNINIRGKLVSLSEPKVMGILNLTPDSFFDGGKFSAEKEILFQVEKMVSEGANIIDIGGMSSRPGAKIISADEELKRILPHLKNIVQQFPDLLISIDTVYAKTANECLHQGAHIINDISAGRFDNDMLETVSAHHAPFVIMHMQGLPDDMQQNPWYSNVVLEVMDFFSERIESCRALGINDVILDPGFGFGKTIEHNYELLRNLKFFNQLNAPILAGLSRKSMITKVLNIKPADALNGTTALNTIALLNGANILRVHDVKEAKEITEIVRTINK